MDQPLKPPTEIHPGKPPEVKKPRSGRRFVWTIVLILLMAGGVAWWNGHRQEIAQAPAEKGAGRGGRSAGGAPMSIVPETVGKGDIGISLNALGTVTSLATVTIRSQISGYLVKVAFKEGDEVKKGDLLAEIELASL